MLTVFIILKNSIFGRKRKTFKTFQHKFESNVILHKNAFKDHVLISRLNQMVKNWEIFCITGRVKYYSRENIRISLQNIIKEECRKLKHVVKMEQKKLRKDTVSLIESLGLYNSVLHISYAFYFNYFCSWNA